MNDDYYQTCAIPKPEPRKRTKGREKRVKAKTTGEVRQYVFARERNLCRCCRIRPAESMHEIRFRSLGGKVSRTNSIAVCGSGTTGYHGYMQSHQIAVVAWGNGAEGTLTFGPLSPQAIEWMRLAPGQVLESAPMVQVEAEA